MGKVTLFFFLRGGGGGGGEGGRRDSLNSVNLLFVPPSESGRTQASTEPLAKPVTIKLFFLSTVKVIKGFPFWTGQI